MKPLNLLILCGSVTGAAHSVAFALKEWLAQNHIDSIVERQPQNTVINTTLNSEQWDALILVSSTTGMGELPPEMAQFVHQCRETYPLLNQKPYAIIGLGNRYYEDFCAAANILEELMPELQGRLLCETLRIDACEHTIAADALPNWVKEQLSPSLSQLKGA